MREVPIDSEFLNLSAVQTVTVGTSKARVLAFAGLGNALELYDFTLYGIMLPFFIQQFLPTTNPVLSVLIGYCSFALTFLVAPLGAIFWGWYGERYGRPRMLRLSMLIMAIPSLIIALVPNYDAIGIIAPIVLICARILQGISSGGEIMGAKLFAMEQLGKEYYGRSSGWISAAGAMGVLMGLGMAFSVSSFGTTAWAWRVPFVVGSLLFAVAYQARNFIQKCPVSASVPPLGIFNIFTIVRTNPVASMVVFILGAHLGISSYALHAFSNNYLVEMGLASNLVYTYSIIGMMATVLAALVTGVILDKYKTSLAFTKGALWSFVLLYVPLFMLLLQGELLTLAGYLGLDTMLGAYATVSAVVMYKAYNPGVRCRGLLFSYALGCSLFGGMTPIAMQLLSVFHPLAPALLPSAAALICLALLRKVNINANLL